jgi:biotin carboxyl carrier protein
MNKEQKLGYLNINSSLYYTRISSRFAGRKPYQLADPRIIRSFIPGTITEIYIQEGQSVKKGDDLLILDAMKMQNKLKCSMDGVVKSINVIKGDKIPKGSILIILE